MLRNDGQDRSLAWFGQGRFTFPTPRDGRRDDAPIARDGFDKSQNVVIPSPSVLFGQHRRVNAPNQAAFLPCNRRYSAIAPPPFTSDALGRAEQPVRFSAFYLW